MHPSAVLQIGHTIFPCRRLLNDTSLSPDSRHRTPDPASSPEVQRTWTQPFYRTTNRNTNVLSRTIVAIIAISQIARKGTNRHPLNLLKRKSSKPVLGLKTPSGQAFASEISPHSPPGGQFYFFTGKFPVFFYRLQAGLGKHADDRLEHVDFSYHLESLSTPSPGRYTPLAPGSELGLSLIHNQVIAYAVI